ncbi:zinc metalloproteinase-disintegrin-like VLAIP-B isoform X2 [Hyperolius riggenbachi]|uniref:zinc metalloproteinase-disintegrin-like VLAIP-B isoform X2 n=1 Tax=Hyperolius riggenbachi TaxID=752182 RepID=UPI0035A26674
MLGAALLLLLALLDSQLLALNKLPANLKYEVVVPEKLHSWHKRDTQNKCPDQVQYRLHVEGQPVLLHLQKTEGLISEHYTETTYLDNGTRVTISPEDKDHCCYQGYVKQDDQSRLSICTFKGLSGVFHARNRRYLIEPLNQTDDGEHAVYESPEEPPKTCGVTNETWVEGKVSKSSRSSNTADKQAFMKSQKFVQLYIVMDKSMWVKYNRSKERLKERAAEMMNYVNEAYKAINTFVALIGLEIWDKKDLFEVVTSANVNLGRFSTWRQEDLLSRKFHDNAQFVTNTDFDGATVGLAFVGTMCSDSHSTGVIQDHSNTPSSVGATIAHEMGHNLGMNHDMSSCVCSADSCIMSPSLSYNTPHLFSSCSLKNFQEFIFDRMPVCMRDEPSKEYIESPAVCGNKFTEIGEDCDCGSAKECTNPCCDPATCKFKNKAQCAEGECCENCKFKKSRSVCRAVKDDCDLPEMCNGKSAVCPQDRFIYNGYPCNDGQGFCYNGKCPSLEAQCSALWGAGSSVGTDTCFNVNRRGTSYGYCQKKADSYVACDASDVKCGVLFCSGGSNNPSVSASVASVANCRAVLHSSGMVQNGTMCGDGKVCYLGKCVTVNSAFRSADCSAACPGHGVCDHELQCRCQEGWAPPNCDTTSDTNIGIIVAIALIALALVTGLVLMFVFRKKMTRCGSRSPSAIAGATNPAYIGPQARKKSGSHLSTPEMSSRNLLHAPPSPAQKPQISHPQSKDGYLGPHHSVTSSVEMTKKSPGLQRPVIAPPPVPPTAPPSAPVTAPPPAPATAPPPVPVTAPPPVPPLKPVPPTAPSPVPPTKSAPPTAPPPVPATKPPPPGSKPVLPAPPTKALKPPVKK